MSTQETGPAYFARLFSHPPSSHMTHRILVTGVGAIIGYGILGSLRQSNLPLRLYGTDIFPDAYGRALADEFIPGVRAYSDGYLAFIERVVSEHAIDLVIPGIEQDLYSLWEKRDRLPARRPS